jgi:hypothetical protein
MQVEGSGSTWRIRHSKQAHTSSSLKGKLWEEERKTEKCICWVYLVLTILAIRTVAKQLF